MPQLGAKVVVSDIGTDAKGARTAEIVADEDQVRGADFKRQHRGVIVNTGSEAGLVMVFNSAVPDTMTRT
jgi:hypothetical protein